LCEVLSDVHRIARERRRIVIKGNGDELQAARTMLTIEISGNQMQAMQQAKEDTEQCVKTACSAFLCGHEVNPFSRSLKGRPVRRGLVFGIC
jgi:hypothetical protein